jgi:hypothetical protein
VGSLDPDFIHVPGVFVQRIYKATTMQKRIERLCVLTDDGVASSSKKKSSSDAAMRERIIRRAALEFEVCWCVLVCVGVWGIFIHAMALTAGRHVCQSGHRHAYAGQQLHPAWHERRFAEREWRPRSGVSAALFLPLCSLVFLCASAVRTVLAIS